jgi:hypothetical protein
LTYMCIYYLQYIHPLNPFPTTTPLPLVPTLTPSWQNQFHPPFLQYCRRKLMKDNKRNIVFLLV